MGGYWNDLQKWGMQMRTAPFWLLYQSSVFFRKRVTVYFYMAVLQVARMLAPPHKFV